MCWRVVVIGDAALRCSPPPGRKVFRWRTFQPPPSVSAYLVSGAPTQVRCGLSHRTGAWALPPRCRKSARPVVPAPTRVALGTPPQPWRAFDRRVARHHEATHSTTPGSPRAQAPEWPPRSRQARSRLCRPPTASAPTPVRSPCRDAPDPDGFRLDHAAARTADGRVLTHRAPRTPRSPPPTVPLGRQSQARPRNPAREGLRKCLPGVHAPPSQSRTTTTPATTDIQSVSRCAARGRLC